jgi:hypothetical protein
MAHFSSRNRNEECLDMRNYIIERDLTGSNSRDARELQRMVVQTNRTLARIAPDTRWIQTYFSADKSFSVVSINEAAITAFLAMTDSAGTRVSEITATIDDSRAGGVRAVWTAMDSWIED